MSKYKPLILADGQLQQLQGNNELDIPLAERVVVLEQALALLVTVLLEEGFALPEELLWKLPC